MVGHAPNVHSLRFKVEQVHESRLGHGRVSGVVVCGLQKSAKSGAGRDIRHPAPAPGLGGGGNVDAGGPLLLNYSNSARVEKSMNIGHQLGSLGISLISHTKEESRTWVR